MNKVNTWIDYTVLRLKSLDCQLYTGTTEIYSEFNVVHKYLSMCIKYEVHVHVIKDVPFLGFTKLLQSGVFFPSDII